MTPAEQQLTDKYLQILEKTNQQLGLWSNPYGIAVGILTGLVALLAIFVAYALWRNSREQRELSRKFFKEQGELAKKFFDEQEKIIRERNVGMKKVQEGYEGLIKEYEKKLKGPVKADKKVRKAIDDLRREMTEVGARIGPANTFTDYTRGTRHFSDQDFGVVEPVLATCPKCKKLYSRGLTPYAPFDACPYCGYKHYEPPRYQSLS